MNNYNDTFVQVFIQADAINVYGAKKWVSELEKHEQ